VIAALLADDERIVAYVIEDAAGHRRTVEPVTAPLEAKPSPFDVRACHYCGCQFPALKVATDRYCSPECFRAGHHLD
jgi:hypothetical protein